VLHAGNKYSDIVVCSVCKIEFKQPLNIVSRCREGREVKLRHHNRRCNRSICRAYERAFTTTLATMNNDERPYNTPATTGVV
jgi:hypothetical protein